MLVTLAIPEGSCGANQKVESSQSGGGKTGGLGGRAGKGGDDGGDGEGGSRGGKGGESGGLSGGNGEGGGEGGGDGSEENLAVDPKLRTPTAGASESLPPRNSVGRATRIAKKINTNTPTTTRHPKNPPVLGVNAASPRAFCRVEPLLFAFSYTSTTLFLPCIGFPLRNTASVFVVSGTNCVG